MITSLEEFLKEHDRERPDGQRLGQRFVNRYIKSSWSELFYEENEQVARILIASWLADHQYLSSLPERLTPSGT